MYYLARVLGKTAQELKDNMTAAEFGDWQAIYMMESRAAEPEAKEIAPAEFLKASRG